MDTEEKIKAYRRFFSKRHDESFILLPGRGTVMISAPHSAEQTRLGAPKTAERQTGVLALLLHDALNCPVIYKTRNCGDDVNYDPQSPYKDALTEYIAASGVRFLLDLHQLAPRRPEKIDLGTGGFRNLTRTDALNVVLKEFTQRNLGTVQLGIPFDASAPNTVSSHVRRICGIQCLQVEINSVLLNDGLDGTFGSVFEALKECVIRLDRLPEEEPRYE